ncbi:hypothetical protein CDCA_CDCA18G4493 [Cyanidium caldarium]|uniref:t-SNARE coiled-coil homology domain-containing protein n=1 Tax=Cyanidium caldarium TaxID=2771 RepID=A0AAV9J1J0_CYACA|nr:hypothetical protein CDCA_CDCA18G4493 [Cyanidium caldarium]
MDDPFPEVRKEVERVWAELEHERRSHAAFTDPTWRAEWVRRLQAARWDVADLAETVRVVESHRDKFDVSDAELQERRAFVERARRELERLEEVAGSTPQGRQLSWAPDDALDYEAQRSVARYDKQNDAFLQDEQRHQVVLVEQQDADLDDMVEVVQRIGSMGLAMRTEAQRHVQLIDEIDTEMGTVRQRFRLLRRRVEGLIREHGRKNLCTLLWLFVTFIVLTMLVISL